MKSWPLIIIGMHRSGTTMLSKILENLGIFMGAKKEINNEATFFIKINDWILRQFNASWDQPYNMNFVDDEIIKHLSKVLLRPIRDFRAIEFLGIKYFLKYRDLRKLNIPWGWKDPRTTFTIDIWKDIFKNAKILHIYRNPLDVAESLRKREEKLSANFKMTLSKHIKEIIMKGKIGYASSFRLRNIKEGILLWKQYIEKAFSLNNNTKNILHIKYEDLLTEPEKYLDKIFSSNNFLINRTILIKQ
ncbi:MAG: sulfotransferase [Proteobacteria bacterium]|nr:sulfotransferase [Pseudomonadota bacterium]